MAEKRGPDIRATWVATGDLSGSQYRLLVYDNDYAYTSTTSAPATYAGVLQNKPQNGEHVSVIGMGHSKVVLAGSVGAGARLMAGANGLAVVATSGQVSPAQAVTNGDSGHIIAAMIDVAGTNRPLA